MTAPPDPTDEPVNLRGCGWILLAVLVFWFIVGFAFFKDMS